jgi:DNA helicase HerA-like ATPase
MNSITHLGQTTGRNKQVFGIKDEDRLSHLYVVGATGSGKTSLLKSMAIEDAKRGLGVLVLDPHGDLASDLHRLISPFRPVTYIDVADPNCPYGFNPV